MLTSEAFNLRAASLLSKLIPFSWLKLSFKEIVEPPESLTIEKLISTLLDDTNALDKSVVSVIFLIFVLKSNE